MAAAAAFEIDEIVYVMAFQIADFQTLARFSRVCRRSARIVAIHRQDIYAAHSEEKYNGFCVNYFVYGRPHRDGDRPAITTSRGEQRWYQYGRLHRDNDQPATVGIYGSKRWYQRGQLHRDGDRPAAFWLYGATVWYQRGQIHRDNDQPAMLGADDERRWYWRGLLHRAGRWPAIRRADGSCVWYWMGVRTHEADELIFFLYGGSKKKLDVRARRRGSIGLAKNLRRILLAVRVPLAQAVRPFCRWQAIGAV